MKLVDWAGRSQREGKRGFIKAQQPALLATLGLSANQWCLLATELEKDSATKLDGLAKLEKLERRDAEKNCSVSTTTPKPSHREVGFGVSAICEMKKCRLFNSEKMARDG